MSVCLLLSYYEDDIYVSDLIWANNFDIQQQKVNLSILLWSLKFYYSNMSKFSSLYLHPVLYYRIGIAIWKQKELHVSAGGTVMYFLSFVHSPLKPKEGDETFQSDLIKRKSHQYPLCKYENNRAFHFFLQFYNTVISQKSSQLEHLFLCTYIQESFCPEQLKSLL